MNNFLNINAEDYKIYIKSNKKYLKNIKYNNNLFNFKNLFDTNVYIRRKIY